MNIPVVLFQIKTTGATFFVHSPHLLLIVGNLFSATEQFYIQEIPRRVFETIPDPSNDVDSSLSFEIHEIFSNECLCIYLRIYTSHVWQHVSRVIRVLSSISRISFIIAFSHMIFILLMGRNPAPVDMENLPFITQGFIRPRWLT